MSGDYDDDLEYVGFRATSLGSIAELGCVHGQIHFTELPISRDFTYIKNMFTWWKGINAWETLDESLHLLEL